MTETPLLDWRPDFDGATYDPERDGSRLFGSQRKIAAAFGIHQTTVGRIKRGERWGHL